MFGASRFRSMARCCDARTPDTDTVDSVTAFFSASLPVVFLALAFLVSGDGGVGAVCVVLACVAWPSAWTSANVDAALVVDTTANSDTVTANDNGCLRNT